MLSLLKNRLPATKDIFLALSMAAFLIFSWSLRALFYNVPSFILSYLPGEILAIVAYMLAVALLESLAIMLFALILAVILPGKFLKEGFSYKASFMVMVLAGISIHLQFTMSNQPSINSLLFELGRGVVIWLVAVLLVHYIAGGRRIVLDILDRITIFSYLYLPLGVLSLFVVIIRLLW